MQLHSHRQRSFAYFITHSFPFMMTGSYLHPPNEDRLFSHLSPTSCRAAYCHHTLTGTALAAHLSAVHSTSSHFMSSSSSSSSADSPFSPAASVVIDIPAFSSQPPQPSSPSHHHSTSPLSGISLERYWPLIAVTIASIYLITLVPFVAPGLFLIQFSLLRYIRHHNDKADALNASYYDKHGRELSGERRMRDAERVRRRSLRPPVMDVIVEETEAAVVEEERHASKDKALAAKCTSPLHAHRPPPLFIPHHDMGQVTLPTPLSSSSSPSSDSCTTYIPAPSASSTSLPAVFPLAKSSAAWDEASQELHHLLHSSMQLLHGERQVSADNFMAATAALFAPSLFQPLASNPSTPTSACSSSSSLSPRPSSVASTASTDQDESFTSSSYPHSPPPSDDPTLTPHRRDATKRFSFDGPFDSDSAELTVIVVDRAQQCSMEELMRNV